MGFGQGRIFRGKVDMGESGIMQMSLWDSGMYSSMEASTEMKNQNQKVLKEWNKGRLKWTQIISSSDPGFLMECLKSCFSKECKNWNEYENEYKIWGSSLYPARTRKESLLWLAGSMPSKPRDMSLTSVRRKELV